MGRLVVRTRVTRISKEGTRVQEDQLAAEEPLEIRVDDEPLTVTMRTPGHDVDLALGFLLAEGVIHAHEDVVAARFCAPPGQVNTYNVVNVQLAVPAPPARRVLTTSACGICGRRSLDEVITKSRHSHAEDLATVDARVLTELPDRLREAQTLFERTGGLHAAGLFTTDGELFVAREDVGRHNAVDKVIGWAMRERGLPVRSTVLMVSGRASFELVQKAHLAGIATLASVSAPSSLAVELALDAGMTLVGFLRGDSMNVYSGEQRVEMSDGSQTSPL